MSSISWFQKIGISVVALHVADTITTVYGLTRGATEVGAAASPMLESMGFAGLFLLTAVGIVAQLVILKTMPRQFRKAGVTLTLGLACFPIINNVITISAL